MILNREFNLIQFGKWTTKWDIRLLSVCKVKNVLLLYDTYYDTYLIQHGNIKKRFLVPDRGVGGYLCALCLSGNKIFILVLKRKRILYNRDPIRKLNKNICKKLLTYAKIIAFHRWLKKMSNKRVAFCLNAFFRFLRFLAQIMPNYSFH